MILSENDFTSMVFRFAFEHNGAHREFDVQPEGRWQVECATDNDGQEYILVIELDLNDHVNAYVEAITLTDFLIADEAVGEEMFSDYLFSKVCGLEDGTLSLILSKPNEKSD